MTNLCRTIIIHYCINLHLSCTPTYTLLNKTIQGLKRSLCLFIYPLVIAVCYPITPKKLHYQLCLGLVVAFDADVVAFFSACGLNCYTSLLAHTVGDQGGLQLHSWSESICLSLSRYGWGAGMSAALLMVWIPLPFPQKAWQGTREVCSFTGGPNPSASAYTAGEQGDLQLCLWSESHSLSLSRDSWETGRSVALLVVWISLPHSQQIQIKRSVIFHRS